MKLSELKAQRLNEIAEREAAKAAREQAFADEMAARIERSRPLVLDALSEHTGLEREELDAVLFLSGVDAWTHRNRLDADADLYGEIYARLGWTGHKAITCKFDLFRDADGRTRYEPGNFHVEGSYRDGFTFVDAVIEAERRFIAEEEYRAREEVFEESSYVQRREREQEEQDEIAVLVHELENDPIAVALCKAFLALSQERWGYAEAIESLEFTLDATSSRAAHRTEELQNEADRAYDEADYERRGRLDAEDKLAEVERKRRRGW